MGRPWPPAEVAARAGGRLRWSWRAVDERGQTLDGLLQAHRDAAAAERFVRRRPTVAGGAGGVAPGRVTTGKLGSYAAAPARRRNNRGEQAHRPTRLRERVRPTASPWAST